jgi:hypothetical protein
MAVLSPTVVLLATSLAWAFEMTPAVQKEIDRQVEVVKSWAADPVLVKAVAAQNEKGPIADMDNTPIVKGFQATEAGQWLRAKAAASNDVVSEAFLNGARGEKVAFIEKTTSYIHKGSAKFDVPFDSGKAWQGKFEFDESSQVHQVQVSVPVVSAGKPIGVLVVGLNVTKLSRVAQK